MSCEHDAADEKLSQAWEIVRLVLEAQMCLEDSEIAEELWSEEVAAICLQEGGLNLTSLGILELAIDLAEAIEDHCYECVTIPPSISGRWKTIGDVVRSVASLELDDPPGLDDHDRSGLMA